MNSSYSSENILVLGTAQDGGFPQTGCRKECCIEAWNDTALKRLVSSLAILLGNDCYLIDMTPDFSLQLKMIETRLNIQPRISGVFITHAHVGHYMGLLEFGLEIMNTENIPIYVMPKMKIFLEENAPFTQLIELNNIKLKTIEENLTFDLNKNISIRPFEVPHRNEYSETVGFEIKSKNKSLVYISDIDAWDQWDMDINDLIRSNDIVLLDGTFYNDAELLGRNMQAVPHPFIQDSLQQISLLEKEDRKKVYFTHLNHTNPVIKISSLERKEIIKMGCHVAEDGMVFTL